MRSLELTLSMIGMVTYTCTRGMWTVEANDSVPSFGVPIFFYMHCDKFESRNFRHFSVSDLVVPLTMCEHV